VAKRRRDLDYGGDLQAEVMAAVWELGEARVDDVRARQPAARRSAYTTIQTVMNRLVERGLLVRQREGKAFVYRPRYDEAEYLSRSIGSRLAKASPSARRAALTSLIGELDAGDLDELAAYAERIRTTRRRGKR
jgi:predicted transcriptional regulator